MTVSELIEALNKIENKELEVIIDGDGVGWECTEVRVKQYTDGTASVQILH